MMSSIHSRKAQIALVIVVAFVAVVVPACRMVGCSMGGAMAWGHMDGAGFFNDCGGEYITNSTPTAVVPSGADSLTLALVAAVMLALSLFTPRVSVQRIRSHSSDPPPPPTEPRGERFRV